MERLVMKEKLKEIDNEMSAIMDITDILDNICNGENLEDYSRTLYVLIESLKQKSLKLDYLHCELKYMLMKNNTVMYS